MMIEPRTKSVEAGVWVKLGAGIKDWAWHQAKRTFGLALAKESLKANSPKRDKQKTTISIRSDQIDSGGFSRISWVNPGQATKGVIINQTGGADWPLSVQRGWKER